MVLVVLRSPAFLGSGNVAMLCALFLFLALSRFLGNASIFIFTSFKPTSIPQLPSTRGRIASFVLCAAVYRRLPTNLPCRAGLFPIFLLDGRVLGNFSDWALFAPRTLATPPSEA